jgi:hypothetical protein
MDGPERSRMGALLGRREGWNERLELQLDSHQTDILLNIFPPFSSEILTSWLHFDPKLGKFTALKTSLDPGTIEVRHVALTSEDGEQQKSILKNFEQEK